MIRNLHAMSAGNTSILFSIGSDGGLEISKWDATRTSWVYHRRKIAAPAGYTNNWDEYVHLAAGKTERAGSDLFAVTKSGSLLLFELSVTQDSLSKPIVLDRTVVSPWFWRSAPWHHYISVFAGSHGALYAIDGEGSLLYYRVIAQRGRRLLESKEPIRLSTGSGPGSAWDAVEHADAGSDGALYVVRSDGRLGYYRHIGALDGTDRLDSRSEATLDRGWRRTAHLTAGVDGELFAITEGGNLRYARHHNHRSRSSSISWAKTAKMEANTTIAGAIDGGWLNLERAARLRFPDGTPIPRRGKTERVRTNGKSLEVLSEYAALELEPTEGRSGTVVRSNLPFRVMFQNMQLFPDTLGDVFSPEIAAGLRVLISASTAAAAGAAIGLGGLLLGPVGAAAGVLAAIFGAGTAIHKKINPLDLGAVALDTPLYKGAGRKAQLDRLIELLEKSPDRVVGLCEMWVPDEAQQVIDAVKTKYPYSLYGPHNEPDPLSGGLLLLSSDPITAADSLVFRSSQGEDALSSKGALFARIDDAVDVFITHFQSDNPELSVPTFGPGRNAADRQGYQLRALRSFVESCRNPDLPALVVGDFNLDAVGGAFKPGLTADQRNTLRAQQSLLREVMNVDAHLPTHETFVDFVEDRAPTSSLSHYGKSKPPVPDPSNVVHANGKQIDLYYAYPGATMRREIADVERVHALVTHDDGSIRQMSDHLGVRTTVRSAHEATVDVRRGPKWVKARVSRVHCLLESIPRTDSDDLKIRLTVRTGSTNESVQTPEKEVDRFRLYDLPASPAVTINAPRESMVVRIDLIEDDTVDLGPFGTAGEDDHIGVMSKQISHRHLLGHVDIPPSDLRDDDHIVTTRRWFGVIRKAGAEYCVEVEFVSAW